MAVVELTEKFLGQIAGWQAMQEARALLQTGQVLSSNWTPPVLKGFVQTSATSYRAGLVIKDAVNVDNFCTCRSSREWGTICAHSVAVGLHHLKSVASAVAAVKENGKQDRSGRQPPAATKPAGKRLLRAENDAAGEPSEIFIILPPNLESAVARGKVMVYFEGAWSRGRTPLNSLPQHQAFRFSQQDLALLDHIEHVAEGDTPAALMLDPQGFVTLLNVLTKHPRVTLGKAKTVTVNDQPHAPKVKATLEADGCITLTSVDRMAVAPCVIAGQWIFHQQTLQPLGSMAGASPAMEGGRRRLSRAQVPSFLMQDWPRLVASGALEANFRPEDFTLATQAPRFLLHLAGGLAQLQAQLQCAYGPRIMTIGVTSEAEALWLPDPTSPTTYSTRDVNAERAAIARLVRNGFSAPDAQGRLQLHGQNAVLNFFAREFGQLQREWEVTLEERLERSTAKNLERLEPRFEINPSGVQWFDLGVVFESPSGERLSPADIQRLILSGQSHRQLRNGKFALIDTGAVEELQEVLRDCSPRQHEQGYRLRNTQAGFLQATLEEQGWQAISPPTWRERARQQSGAAELECPPLGELDDVLRPYQKAGVAWLHFLRANHFGGILADEMGLGKTLQALAFVQSAMGRSPAAEAGNAVDSSQRGRDTFGVLPSGGTASKPPKGGTPNQASPTGSEPTSPAEGQRKGGPTLIVCPTSLVFNWVAEAKKFTPHLKVLALQGSNRQTQFAEIAQYDLVVTSYALIRRDAEHYRDVEFDTVILDEAQHIKNRQTQNAQAVKAVRARYRLVLTGTPLENSVLDLWSIFDFLMPGYLGTARDFRERYEGPITRDKNEAAQSRLARRLRPFILRRTKRDVAPDLPERLEQVAYCELTDDQRGVYQQVFEATRREVLAAVGDQGLARSRMIVLNALLRLRQVCCDLRLLKLDQVNPATASGKLELFSELLEEVLDGGHRVLVFSQFVSMLTLLREKLTAEQIEFCYLDGSTKDRGAVVERFQRQASIPVFLISLKAGGLGLNLTGADTVIHFDPWWNPAVEAQATDRAHRIGQTRVVTSYKLITRDTVEEKILRLQARKREVIHATLGGEKQLAEALTWKEIQELLA